MRENEKKKLNHLLKRLIIIISLFFILIISGAYEIKHIEYEEKQRSTISIKTRKSVLFFFKDDCKACRKIYPIVKILYQGKLPIQIINTNNATNHKKATTLYNVKTVPTFILIDDKGRELMRYSGSNILNIRKILNNEMR